MKNLLVLYRGGGYGGCIWEKNFFYWNGDGEFVNAFSSGCMGVKNEEKAIEKLNEYREYLKNPVGEQEIHILPYKNKRLCKEFVGLWQEVHIPLLIMKVFEQECEVHGIVLPCVKCGGDIASPEDIGDENSYTKGDGGVGIINCDVECYECYTSHTCSNCSHDYEFDRDRYPNAMNILVSESLCLQCVGEFVLQQAHRAKVLIGFGKHDEAKKVLEYADKFKVIADYIKEEFEDIELPEPVIGAVLPDNIEQLELAL